MKKRQWLRRLALGGHLLAKVCAIAVVLFFVGLEVAASWSSYDLTLIEQRPEASLTVIDRDGNVLADRVNRRGERHRWVALDAMSPWVVAGTVVVEDAGFYDHEGVDWSAVLRATVNNVRLGRIASGASTITMQLARMLQPYRRNSVWGKLTATVRALRLERALSKAQILEEYLNRAPYGAGAIGIETASLRYFGRPTTALTLSEATLLVGLPGAPTKFNPLKHYERALRRRAVVLRRLLEEGKIELTQWSEAMVDRPRLSPRANPGKAPHLTDALGRAHPAASASRVIHTMVDAGLQADVEAIVADHVRDLAVAGAPHAAAVVVDNKRCDVVAMVGSPGYRTPMGAVNGAMALRQPGSTLKPFVYALAFERGAHAGTVVADVPTRYRSPDGTLHTPRNYDRTYSGPVSMGRALAASLNVPAIATAQREGLGRLYRRLKSLGFESLDRPPEHYGLGLALGNGEVRLTELAQGYAALARGGRGCRLRWSTRDPVVDKRVFPAEVAARITSVLADAELRQRAFGLGGALMLDEPLALKSGTSPNWRDNWVIGYTGDHTVAVWVGDFANRSTAQLTGLAGAGPLFKRLVEHLLDRTPREKRRPLLEAKVRAELPKLQVCPLSGRPPGAHCPHRITVYGAPHSVDGPGSVSCQWHRRVRVHRPTGKLAGDGCALQDAHEVTATYLPPEYGEWEAMTAHADFEGDGGGSVRGPTEVACGGSAIGATEATHTGGDSTPPQVAWPLANDIFVVDPSRDTKAQSVRFRVTVPSMTSAATWFINGEQVAQVAWPFELVWPLAQGEHVVEVAANGARSRPVRFSVK